MAYDIDLGDNKVYVSMHTQAPLGKETKRGWKKKGGGGGEKRG